MQTKLQIVCKLNIHIITYNIILCLCSHKDTRNYLYVLYVWAIDRSTPQKYICYTPEVYICETLSMT